MSSPSPFGGSLFCDEIPRSGRGMTQDLGNSRISSLRGSKATEAISKNFRFSLRNSRIPYYVILGLDPRISVMGSPDQVGG